VALVVLTGGARSGKSSLAVRSARADGRAVTVVATAEAGDDEMAARIAAHRRDRPDDWTVVEAPVAVVDALGAADPGHVVIVDCLALWVTNQLDRRDDAILAAADTLADTAARRPAPTIVVTNEVGDGVVPASASGRRFRDLLGAVNQRVVDRADEALLCVAGRTTSLHRTDTIALPARR